MSRVVSVIKEHRSLFVDWYIDQDTLITSKFIYSTAMIDSGLLPVMKLSEETRIIGFKSNK